VQLEGILGRPPDAALISEVYQRGGGVPLLTEALVSSDGTVSAELPTSLRDLLLAAVAVLPERTQQALRTSAAGGARLSHLLLAAVTGLDDASLTAALRPAVEANVLVSDSDGYAFRHQLIREAVLEEMLPGERAQAHRAFAAAMEARLEAGSRAGPESTLVVLAALHWRGAQDDERALAAAWRAAGAAGTALAYAQRLRMLEQVLELWDRVPEPARPAGLDHVGVLELAADAARWAGEPERGLALAETAIAELDAVDDAERMALMLRRRAGLRQELLLPGQLGDEEHRVEADMALASLGALRGEDTMAALRGAQEAAQRAGFGLLEAWAYLTITNALEGGGRHELAIPAGREGLARARQLGLGRQIAAPIAGNLAESLTSAGRWDEAVEILDEVLGLDLPPLGRFGPLVIRAHIAVARGDDETAERMLDELRSLPAGVQAESQRLLSLARLEIDARLARGDLAGALNAGRAALVRDLPADPRYLWPLLAAAMRACAEASAVSLPPGACDPGRLRKDLELRAGSADRPGPLHEAWAATFAAEAARADGRHDLAGWDTAAAAWAALAQPQEEAYALLRAAVAGRSNRDIAAELFISPKTASVHVSNILGKLGVSSRGEAAATAYRQHLLDGS